MDVGQIIKRPDGGWFWSLSVIKCNPPPQGAADSKEVAQRDMRERWERWLKEAGLR